MDNKEDIIMNWICSKCKKTVTTNSSSAKPTPAGCIKDNNGRPQPHNWIKR